MSASTRRLLARLRDALARGAASLPQITRMVATELVAEVCSVYAMRPGDLLELVATEGLRQSAVGHTRLRVGEGIIGLVAATGEVLNLPDAQNHPAFAYRPETGEEPYASLLAVPIRRAGRMMGVIAVQNRAPRRYSEDEVEVLETVAMLLPEVLAAAGAENTAEGIGDTLPRIFAANVLAGGIAIGTVVIHGTAHPPSRVLADDPEAELKRLAHATERMRHGLDALIAERLPDGDAPREVLETYRLIAADAGWLKRISEAVRGGVSAEAAVHRVAGELRERMRRVADPYLRERLADLEDLSSRLLGALDGGAEAPPAPGAILVARRLGPTQLLDWHRRGIAGVVIEEGSPAGHAAILARSLGLPALGGARGVVEAAEEGDEAVIDADEGQFILRPEQDVCSAYQRALEARNAERAGWQKLRHLPSVTADGTPIRLMLNVGLRMELDQLDITGAEGVGLFRTEIAMLARGTVVDVPEQAAIYAQVLDAAAGRPVLFRTLDLGGDKLLPDAPIPEEENPAMGWRSLRVGLDRPALLRRQLRALLQAADGRPLSVMFPMVATVAEFRQAKALLQAEVPRAKRPPQRLEIGTMLEVPALFWQFRALLAETDFVSIGTNDLMQFLFAADRGTPSIAGRYDFLSPPVLNLVDWVQREAAAARVPVSVCGEVASRPLEALTLVGLGIHALSMPASSLLQVKATLAAVDLPRFRRVLAAIRRDSDAEASFREAILGWAREKGVPL